MPRATRPTLDPNDEAVIAKATVLRDQRSTDPALQVLNERIAQGLTADNPAGLLLLAQIAGLLIDIGSEGHNEQAIQDGLALLEKHHDQLGTLVTDATGSKQNSGRHDTSTTKQPTTTPKTCTNTRSRTPNSSKEKPSASEQNSSA